jgi:hypothetical protein
LRALLAGASFLAIACANEPSHCAHVDEVASLRLPAADVSPVLAVARGDGDLGLAYVVRPAAPQLAHFDFQRLDLAGTPLGGPVRLTPIDMSGDGQVTITHDGRDYLACAVAVGGASCSRIDAGDAVTEDAMVPDAYAIAIASGASDVGAAWIAGGELHVGSLGTTSPRTIATTDATPSIAAMGAGFVVGYAAEGTAFVATSDGSPLALGPSLAQGPVVVTFDAGVVAASYLAPDGAPMLALVRDGSVRTRALAGPGAASVALASAPGELFATWIGPDDAVHGASLDLDGAIAATDAHEGSATAHGVVATDRGFALVVRSDARVNVAILGCL